MMFNDITHILDSSFYNIFFIMVAVWSTGALLEKIKIPLIAGQLLAGIIIGPTVLNLVKQTPEVHVLGQLGVFFLMFYAGFKTNPQEIHKTIFSSLIIGILGTVCPFILGFLAIYYSGGTFLQALFLGMAISGTALATKARILDDFNILKSKIGYSMIGAAICDNILSFIILTLLIKFAQTDQLILKDAIVTSLEIIVFFALTLFIGHIAFPKVSKIFSSNNYSGFTFALVMGLFFALLAELVHLPYILGAYLAGLFVREELMNKELYEKMGDRFLAITHGFLGPFFIVSLTFKVSFTVLWEQPFIVLLVVLAAFSGKLIGVLIGAHISRFNWKDSFIMGVGMNGRGAVELVIAAIGIELGVLNDTHLSIIIFMTFFTTIATPFILQKIMKKSSLV